LERKHSEGGWPLSGWNSSFARSTKVETTGPKSAGAIDASSGANESVIPGSKGRHITPSGNGRVGLYNQGNTCYSNAAVQCLAHIRPLRDYLLSGEYAWDLNVDAPFGQGGRLSVAFASLCAQIWTGTSLAITPRQLRSVLSSIKEDYGTSRQQDAMELLDTLMSTLAEELNRNVVKPYTEQPDSDGRPDDVVAQEWWENHAKRELSIFTALFTGQFRSTLKCVRCGYERCTYEVFTALSLPLPEPDKRPIRVQLFWHCAESKSTDESKFASSGAGTDASLRSEVVSTPWWESAHLQSGPAPMEVSVLVSHKAKVSDLKEAIIAGNFHLGGSNDTSCCTTPGWNCTKMDM